MENVLIATLGESPIVITAMHDLLKKEKGLAIDRVVVLHPNDTEEQALISFAFDLIRQVLQDTYKCAVMPEPLPFEDVANEPETFYFLRTLYRLLDSEQKNANNVYLSLAGGRKNMSALMAILVSLFPCVNGLYHVIDSDEGTSRSRFKSIEYISDLPPDEQLSYFSLTDGQLARLKLVEIPYGKQQQVSEEYRARLYTIRDMAELDDWWAETLDFLDRVEDEEEDAGPGRTLEVLLTRHAAEQFEEMWKYDRTHAREFKFAFERLRFSTIARRNAHDAYTRKLLPGEHDIYSTNLSALTFHYFKIKRKQNTSVERPVFHTIPKDIRHAPDKDVERVIISELVYKHGDDYPSLQEITNRRGFLPLQLHPDDTVDKVLNRVKKAENVPSESVLVVPLGDRPMIATQLYTLLTHQESNICEVVLVYTTKVKAGAELLVKAFEDEGKRIGREIGCIPKPVPGYGDIDSIDACYAFEQTLEAAIDEARKHHPGCQIELALSGGRKGMAALAMFVAQRKDIHYLYHTLIVDTDKNLSYEIEKKTTVDALRSTMVSKEERNDRLFLRAYEGTGPYTKFVLFKVPVLPANG